MQIILKIGIFILHYFLWSENWAGTLAGTRTVTFHQLEPELEHLY